MRFHLSFILALFLSPCVWAQNTQVPETPPTLPMVGLETKLVQVVLNDEHRQGVDWEAIVSDFHSLNLKNNRMSSGANESVGKLSVGTVAGDDYNVLLEALETVGHTNVLSNPWVKATNNKEVKILVGSSDSASASHPSATSDSPNFNDTGIKLFVTPTIHNDESITLKIRPEVTSAVRTSAGGDSHAHSAIETWTPRPRLSSRPMYPSLSVD